MTIHLPDPDIGRCQNCRSFPSAYGLSRSVRCNGLEAVAHTCWFTPPFAAPSDHSQSYVHALPKPKVWIEPVRPVGSTQEDPE